MMNVLQVQDDLKNFSQDQLVKEMQQPSGNAPQFLVLSELNRRKRVKGDFDARQAQNQPTVAEDAVASAGVPQNQMMGMSEAMAPQSAVSDGVGTSAPMKMASGGLAQFGNEIREGMGQEIDPYLDGVQQEAESKFNVDLNNNEMGSIYFGHRGPGSPGTTQPIGLQRPQPYLPGMGGKGMPRTDAMPRPMRGGPEMFNKAFAGARRNYAEGGVVRAANGLPEETSYGDEFLKYIGETGEDIYRVGKAALSGLDEEMLQKLENQPDDTALGRSGKFLGRMINEAHPYNLAQNITDPLYNFATKPLNQYDEDTEQDNKNITEENNALIGDGNKEVETKPKLESTSTEEKPLTIEQELLKRQADLEKNKNSDKWMALAQAGLAIMGSNNPNLAGAIGEGGTAGLTAFSDSNKRYQEGLTDILNARAKMETARLSAAGKGRLTRSSAIQAINTYNTAISSKEKMMQDLMKDHYGEVTPELQAQINAIKNSIVDLETQKSQLFGDAKIRPRGSINVGKLPSKQKAS